MIGADLGGLRALASEFNAAADRIDSELRAVTVSVRNTPWDGATAARFRHAWNSIHSARLRNLAAQLRESARVLRANADDQERVSNAGSTRSSRVAFASGAMTGIVVGSTEWSRLTSSQKVRVLSGMSWADGERAWSSLPEAERRRIAREASAFGNLDSMPPSVRYAINRERVHAEYLRILKEDPGNPRVEVYEKILREHQQVLVFEPEGDGKIAVVHGDLARSRELVVQVPGIDNQLNNYDRMLGDSQRLHGAAGGEGVAVVSWLGYDAPSGAVNWNPTRNLEMASRGYANAGATSLNGFVTALDRQNPDARITVIGHSYGSLVTGLAAGQGMPADQVVLIGSPGAGVRSVDEFVRPDGTRPQVFVGENRTDYVSLGSGRIHPAPDHGWHGAMPADGGFGADHVKRFLSLEGHNYYGAEGEQLKWLGDIVRPQPDLTNANLA